MAASTATALPRYAFGDELASSVIHGIGILLSIAGLATLVAFASLYGDARAIVASAVFGATLILCYTASTLYHSIPGPAARGVLRTLDHIAIFLLIAGTYTPFTLVALPGAWGWSLFGTVWALAIMGIALELGLLKKYRKLAVLMYVGMGWVGVIAFKPLLQHLQAGGMALLLAGSVLHYLAVLLYVIPDVPMA